MSGTIPRSMAKFEPVALLWPIFNSFCNWNRCPLARSVAWSKELLAGALARLRALTELLQFLAATPVGWGDRRAGGGSSPAHWPVGRLLLAWAREDPVLLAAFFLGAPAHFRLSGALEIGHIHRNHLSGLTVPWTVRHVWLPRGGDACWMPNTLVSFVASSEHPMLWPLLLPARSRRQSCTYKATGFRQRNLTQAAMIDLAGWCALFDHYVCQRE